MTQNIDTSEVEKFADLAERWWDPKGELKPLHIINPLRAEFISSTDLIPPPTVIGTNIF